MKEVNYWDIATGIRQARKDARDQVTELLAEEKDGYGYPVQDSVLEGRQGDTQRPFFYDFGCVLPRGENSLRNYIEKTIPSPAIGLELGGTGSSLFGSFSPGFFSETRSISLTDYRDPTVKSLDEARNHDVIPGNFLSSQTKRKVDETWLQGKKVTVLFMRSRAGLRTFPDDPYAAYQHANDWYRFLGEGLLFSEIPLGFDQGSMLTQWRDTVNSSYRNKLEVQMGMPDDYAVVTRMHKQKGAPESLPRLSLEQVERQLPSRIRKAK